MAPDFPVGTCELEAKGALVFVTVFERTESRGMVATFVRHWKKAREKRRDENGRQGHRQLSG